MFPPSSAAHLSLEALSGICGSISIACWVVVFSPQIIENFRRGSADGLSLLFLTIWLAGDVFNILGAVMQGVLPTMIILAVYYTLADIVLLGQCFYYRGFTLSDDVKERQLGEDEQPPQTQDQQNTTSNGRTSEQTPLLNGHHERQQPSSESTSHHEPRRHSSSSITSVHQRRFENIDSSHLSPAVPLMSELTHTAPRPPSLVQIVAFNTFSVTLVCAAGVLGWYISVRSSHQQQQHGKPGSPPSQPPESGTDALKFNLAGQVFGYLCAALYLGSRIPQLLLNRRRKSTEGVSLLFFLFACIGNLTYVLSIFAYSPVCQAKDGRCRPGEEGRIYGRYIAVNASWILGSLGTLFLDMAIFAQFILYRGKSEYDDVACS